MNPLPNKTAIVSIVIAGLSVILAGQPEQPPISRTEWKSWDRQKILNNSFFHPSHITSNPYGDIILLDSETFTIAVISSGGTLRTTGGWGVESERFSYPTDIAVSTGQDIYLCDQASDRILRFDRKLNFISDVDLTELRPTKVEFPSRIAINRLGEMVISEAEQWELYQLSSDSRFISRFGGLSYGEERFGEIADVAVNSRNEIAVLDLGNEQLTILSRAGSILKTAPLPDEEIVAVESWHSGWLIISSNGKLFYWSPDSREFSLVLSIQGEITEIATITDFTIINDRIFAVNRSVVTCRLIIHE